jgi:PAS domain S-box-containing protein
MWDVATPIMVGTKKVGNLFSGQFFFSDETVDREVFQSQARQYGFPEEPYLAALDEVPRLSRATVHSGMRFLTKLAHMLSVSSCSNVQLAQAVAERDALTASLKESTDFLNAAQAIANVGSWKLDLASNQLSWSDEVYRIFGLEPQQFGATYEAFLDIVHPEDRCAVDAAYSSSLKNGQQAYEITHRIVRSGSGEVRWVHEKCHHVTDCAGRVVRSIGMVQDITERKEAEQELKRSNCELMEANRAWEEFGFAASHDLREPLRTVNLYAQMLLRRDALKCDQQASEFAAYIESGIRTMEDLLRDLLSYACASSPEEEGSEVADLNRCLEAALAALGARIQESSPVITWQHLPTVRASGKHIEQVFQNLLSNAMKYTRQGVPPEVTISAELCGGDWVVTVRDQGIGFDPMYADRIFGLFKRLHRNGYPGTGVGLAICRRIVERYGGRIWAESDGVGRGASFSFALSAT